MNGGYPPCHRLGFRVYLPLVPVTEAPEQVEGALPDVPPVSERVRVRA